jgi:hypothetical protein
MNVKKIITTLGGAVIAFVALAITIGLLSGTTKEVVSMEAVFISSPGKQTAVVNPGGLISEKGSLQFGKFALFQLTDEGASLEFISAEFDEKTQVVDSARGRVNSGSVLAVNLLFGNEITLLDDRLAAASNGGSFVFEKNAEANSTRVRVLSGSAKLTFLDAENAEMFEGVLLAEDEIELTDDAIKEIFEAGDEIAQMTSWNNKIGEFSSKFDGEGRLISKLLEKLPQDKSNALTATLSFIKERMLFSSEVREVFYAQKLAGLLAESAAGDPSEVAKFLATSDAKKRALLQKVVAQSIPLTHLFLAETLPPSAKEKITRLADLSDSFTAFAEIKPLSDINKLNRNLIFIADDPSNTKHTRTFLNNAQNGIEISDAETSGLLLKTLKQDPKVVNSDWLDAWAIVNRGRIVTNLDLAAAIIDQLSLSKFLIESGREELAGSALKELVSLLARGSAKFSESSLEGIATEGNELKNRILFLASLRGESEFEEDAYRAWVAEKERLDAQETVEEPDPGTEIEIPEDTPPVAREPDDGKVARPQSELEKFLKFELPTSPTQSAEEEMLQAGKITDAKDFFLLAKKTPGDPKEQARLMCLTTDNPEAEYLEISEKIKVAFEESGSILLAMIEMMNDAEVESLDVKEVTDTYTMVEATITDGSTLSLSIDHGKSMASENFCTDLDSVIPPSA